MSDPNASLPPPTPKPFFRLPDASVLAGGLAGLVAWGLLAAISAIFHFDLGAYLQPYVVIVWSMLPAPMSLSPPPSAQGAIAILIGFAITYLVPDREKDIVKKVDDRIIALARQSPLSPASAVDPESKVVVAPAAVVVSKSAS